MGSQTKVIYSDKGLANFYGDYIEINILLKKDKILRDYIVKHELGHSKTFDVGHEIKDGFWLLRNPKILKRILSFYIKNPSTWKDISPFWWEDKKIVYDLNLCVLYGIIAFIGVGAIYVF